MAIEGIVWGLVGSQLVLFGIVAAQHLAIQNVKLKSADNLWEAQARLNQLVEEELVRLEKRRC